MDIFYEKNIKPMLLTEKDKPFNNKEYIFEIKFDGIRAIIYVSSNEIVIKNKSGKVINELFPELTTIKETIKKKCIFDGEIVLMDKGKPSFSKLQERLFLKDKIKINYMKENNPVTFVCFDILYENKSLIDLPLTKRKQTLNKYEDTDSFVKSRVVNNEGIKLYRFIKENNLEGIVAKKKNSIYLPNKRSDNWIKIKYFKEEDFYICGYKEEDKVISLLLGKKVDKCLKYISKVVMGKKKIDYKLIKSCPITKNKFINLNEKDYTYITPKYKCTILYLEKTKDNHLRSPIYKGIRMD